LRKSIEKRKKRAKREKKGASKIEPRKNSLTTAEIKFCWLAPQLTSIGSCEFQRSQTGRYAARWGYQEALSGKIWKLPE